MGMKRACKSLADWAYLDSKIYENPEAKTNQNFKEIFNFDNQVF